MSLQEAGKLARLHKEAGSTNLLQELRSTIVQMRKEAASAVTGSQLLGHLADVAGKVPGIITGGAKDIGKRVTKATALPGEKPGLIAKGLGKAVEYTPHAAAVYGGTQLAAPHVVPYMQGKVRQFRAREARTRPHYDPVTQRFI